MKSPMDEMREIFSRLRGRKDHLAILWCLMWFGCHTSEFTMLKPEDVNWGEVKA